MSDYTILVKRCRGAWFLRWEATIYRAPEGVTSSGPGYAIDGPIRTFTKEGGFRIGKQYAAYDKKQREKRKVPVETELRRITI